MGLPCIWSSLRFSDSYGVFSHLSASDTNKHLMFWHRKQQNIINEEQVGLMRRVPDSQLHKQSWQPKGKMKTLCSHSHFSCTANTLGSFQDCGLEEQTKPIWRVFIELMN